MNLSLHLAIVGVLVLCLVASYLYRKFIDEHDDHNIHLSGSSTDARTINMQVEHGKRIETLGKVNLYLTIIVVLYLVAIAAMLAYTSWSARGPM
jgi:hypothetical protein